MTTFQYQDQLQKLPIPTLEETCSQYLKVLKPLQNEKEHETTKAAVEKFLKDGTGVYLDSELRKYAETRNSYIEQFWYDSYLNYDSPVVLNLNPFFLLEDDPFNNESMSVNPQVKRAASLTLSSLKFIRALKNETLSVDKLRNKQPLCMYQYTKLFGASRIPTADGCMMQTDPKSNHIVVMSKSQFYWFDVLDSNNDLIMSEQDLVLNFTSIVQDSLSTSISEIAKSSFGVLTTENRRIWAKIRNSKTIKDNENNREVLSIVDSALFILCLDDIKLHDLSDLAKNMLCGLSILDKGVQVGTCTNRWYDKLQIIVTQNGKAGINFEHTGVDGHTVLRFVSDIYTDSILSFASSINGNAPSLWVEDSRKFSSTEEDLVTVPRKLEWDVTPDLSLALRFGETRLSDLINQNEFKHLEFKNYGSSTIKKMKYSPDAFVQMAFQATYYALYGKVECTYEPAMTKQFFHGRTEAIRPVSQESNLFVRKFFDSNVSTKDKLSYLSKACESHVQQTKLCASGKGVDRHLYALFCVWKRYLDIENESEITTSQEKVIEKFNSLAMGNSDTITTENQRASISTLVEDDNETHSSDQTVVNQASESSLRELPSIFSDLGWDKLNNTVLSTSNCGNPALRLFGFGPVSASGFGLGYIIKDDSISICAASKHRQTERFLVTLESYFNEVYRLFKELHDGPTNAPIEAKIRTSPKASKATPSVTIAPTPAKPSPALSTLLGGYGYFDMGEEDIKSRGPSPEPPFLNKMNAGFSVREIGKKLRLSEY
ncbi:putative mitochondrial carnitine O-acetyltransferase [Meyerozyma sp. JA9]|nr:putative mitochondrial carnitine O-acetyltransferase [Meyerozyma sp. JA9]